MLEFIPILYIQNLDRREVDSQPISATQLVIGEPGVEALSGLFTEPLLLVWFSTGGMLPPRGNFNVQRHFGCYNWWRREILSSGR